MGGGGGGGGSEGEDASLDCTWWNFVTPVVRCSVMCNLWITQSITDPLPSL